MTQSYLEKKKSTPVSYEIILLSYLKKTTHVSDELSFLQKSQKVTFPKFEFLWFTFFHIRVIFH